MRHEDPVPLNEQIAEMKREIAMRERVYPGLVSRGKLRQAEADYQIRAMRGALATLQWTERHEAGIRAYAASRKEKGHG